MPRVRMTQTNFSAGELDPRLAARSDLKAYENGAAELRNCCVVLPAGVSRRPGTRYLDELAGEARLVPFEFNTEQRYLLAFSDGALRVYKDGVRLAVSVSDLTTAGALIDRAAGTRIGDMTANGGLAAAFDDDLTQDNTQAAAGAGAGKGACGKTFPAATTISKVECWPTTNYGYARKSNDDDYTQDVVLELRGKTGAAPADYYTDGQLLGELQVRDTKTPWQTVLSTDTITAFDHVWVTVRAVSASTATVYLAEIRLYAAPAVPTLPWTAAMLDQLYWAQTADTLLLTHPDMPPLKITRTSHTTWTVGAWTFVEKIDTEASPQVSHIQQPHRKFLPSSSTLQASATTGTGVTITASHDTFDDDSVGQRYRLAGKEVLITAVTDARTATATVKETLKNTQPTTDWTEPAWSARRGWPVSVSFHQSRLAVGGSRDLPNRIWLSATADFFNFDLGGADDDDAIDIELLDDQVNAVRAVVSATHLLVFTSGAEYMLSGDPLTPTKIQAKRQTRMGSPIDRSVPPCGVDGAVAFVPRTAAGLRIFQWDDVQQAYEAPDLALLAPHLITAPSALCWDAVNRWLHVVNADGTLATLALQRSEQVQAWTLQEIGDGTLPVTGAAQLGAVTYLAVDRDDTPLLLRFDAAAHTDACLFGSDGSGYIWSGLDHLEEAEISVVADGGDAGTFTVTNGQITLPRVAETVEAGLAFTHVIRPLSPSLLQQPEETPASRWRPVTATFRLYQTGQLRLDYGQGAHVVPLDVSDDVALDAVPPLFSGEVSVRMSGWRHTAGPAWRIIGSAPVPLTLLSVETEVSANT
jgi:hypothetical protein